MSFANLAGAWALLGLLAVLAIHLLRRRPRPLTISTLFLLEAAATSSAGGRRVERLRHSLSLWLQLAAAALLAWLLMAPRLLREESAQKVAVVLDGTASMSAFRARALEALARRAERLQRRAARTEWILAESGQRRPPLYSGGDAAALLRAAALGWDPRWPAHDVHPALESAREAVGPAGLVLLVTDHAVTVPAGVDRLAVGEPRDTVGFAGARVEEGGTWKVVVKNHGRAPATRRYTAAVGGQPARPAGTLTLAPGAVHTIAGPFPPGGATLTLELEPDAFALDDRLPLVAPQPKTLHVQVAPEAAALPFVPRFLATLDAVARDGPPDLCIVVASAGARPSPPCPAIVFRAAPAAARFLPPAAAAGTHPLLEGLDWSGLLAPEAPALPAVPDDEVLVWAGPRPLIVLGRGPSGPVLLADFALAGSSAERVPAFPLLLHRFAERVRAGVVGREQANVETGAELPVALRAGGEPARLESGSDPAQTGPLLRAPLAPGFFTVRQGAFELVSGAAHFADTAEADLTEAASDDEGAAEPGRAEATERNSREHPLVPWATLLAGLLMALDWAGPRRSA